MNYMNRLVLEINIFSYADFGTQYSELVCNFTRTTIKSHMIRSYALIKIKNFKAVLKKNNLQKFVV